MVLSLLLGRVPGAVVGDTDRGNDKLMWFWPPSPAGVAPAPAHVDVDGVGAALGEPVPTVNVTLFKVVSTYGTISERSRRLQEVPFGFIQRGPRACIV